MVNRQQTALRKREETAPARPRPAGGAPARPWRQWHSSTQAQQSLPLEVARPSKPQWGRYIYLGIIACIVALVAREVYTGVFWFNAQGAVSGRQYNVSPSQTVTIDEVLIEPSETVKAGQPLVKLNAPDLVQALARNEAEIARIQADLMESTSRIESNREELRARIATAKARVEALESRSRTEIERINAMRRLVAAGAVSKGSLQELEMQHTETWSDYQQAKAELESAYRQSATLAETERSSSDKALPENRLSSLTKLRDSIQTQLNSLELRAPSDGVVATVPVSRGDVLKAGEPAVVMLEQEDIRAFLYFPPSAQGRLKVGQIVPAHTSAGAEFPLRIEKIYPRMESKAGQQYNQLNAPADAALVAEAVPANGSDFPDFMNSGTPIYGRVPRWSIAEDLDVAVKSLFGSEAVASPEEALDADQKQRQASLGQTPATE